jgi:drug/metabolite transporter (DMT)-like permease
MSAVLGVAAAVAAGASFAAAGVLQQRAAARARDQRSLSVSLIAALARQPMWLAGIGLAAGSYGLQALALSAAPLAIVQPLLVTELLFAIPISARLYRRPLCARDWAGILTVAAGLAATVWGAAATDGGGGGTPLRWAIVGGGIACAALALAAAGRRRGPLARATLYAAAAALVFALSSALLASTVAGFAADGLGGLARPAPYGMAAASLAGLLLIQSAFQAGPLAVIMPMVDWVQPLIAVLLGVSVLGESLSTDPAHLYALAVGALVALAGIVTLDTSPRVRAMQPGADPAGAADAARACRAARLGHAPQGSSQVAPDRSTLARSG